MLTLFAEMEKAVGLEFGYNEEKVCVLSRSVSLCILAFTMHSLSILVVEPDLVHKDDRKCGCTTSHRTTFSHYLYCLANLVLGSDVRKPKLL